MKESDLLCRGERREELMSELYTRRPRAYIACFSMVGLGNFHGRIRKEPRGQCQRCVALCAARLVPVCRPVVLQTTLEV